MTSVGIGMCNILIIYGSRKDPNFKVVKCQTSHQSTSASGLAILFLSFFFSFFFWKNYQGLLFHTISYFLIQILKLYIVEINTNNIEGCRAILLL